MRIFNWYLIFLTFITYNIFIDSSSQQVAPKSGTVPTYSGGSQNYSGLSLSPFGISSDGKNKDNKGLWISVTLGDDTYTITKGWGLSEKETFNYVKGSTYILANNGSPAWPNTVEVPKMISFLNNINNVGISSDPNNPSKPNWQDGIFLQVFPDVYKNVWVAAFDHNNNLLVTTILLGGSWPTKGIAWGGSWVARLNAGSSTGQASRFYQSIDGTTPTPSSTYSIPSQYAVIYKNGQSIQQASMPIQNPLTLIQGTILPVVPYKIGVGPNNQDTSQLWLSMNITTGGNTYEYYLANNLPSGTPTKSPAGTKPLDPNGLFITLNNLKVSDWNEGIYFSFIESGGKVSLYVQDVTGKKLGEVIIPGVSSLTSVEGNKISFIGSYISNYIALSPQQTICFTTNAAPNKYVRVPLKVNDPNFNQIRISTVIQTNVNLSPNFWLTMTVNEGHLPNGTESFSYILAGNNNIISNPLFVKAVKNPNTNKTGPECIAFFNNLKDVDFNSGIYFNFIESNQEVFLNIQVGDGKGKISSGMHDKSQIYQLLGLTSITGTVSFGGANMQQPTTIFHNQTWGLLASSTGNFSSLEYYYTF